MTMEDSNTQDISNRFDELFLWNSNEITEQSKQLFTALGIEWFAEIVARTKKYWFNASHKILTDLVRLSFLVYVNWEKLPLQKKIILPKKSWSYKFIVMSLPDPSLRWPNDPSFSNEDTNVIFLFSTGDSMHADIAAKAWLDWKPSWTSYILWWAWIDINHEDKRFHIRDTSGAYWSCSNQIVEWLLEEYKQQWYEITLSMSEQQEFFPDAP